MPLPLACLPRAPPPAVRTQLHRSQDTREHSEDQNQFSLYFLESKLVNKITSASVGYVLGPKKSHPEPLSWPCWLIGKGQPPKPRARNSTKSNKLNSPLLEALQRSVKPIANTTCKDSINYIYIYKLVTSINI